MDSSETVVYGVLYLIVLATLVLGSVIAFIVALIILIKNKRTYECKECHNRSVLGIDQTMFCIRCGTARLLYCPVCKKKCWHKHIF